MFTFLAWCELQQKDKYFQRKKSLIDQRKGYLRRSYAVGNRIVLKAFVMRCSSSSMSFLEIMRG
ncbi:hypothetical protein, partial [Acetobacter pasteurianus]|uniref:hypothetical protein n=1 Tax=Acetobacter pasteurianus TaxID=438 RepID=UPI001BDFB84D